MRRFSLTWFVLFLSVAGQASAGEREEQFWKAAKQGDVAAVKRLLARKVDVNARTPYGATALAFACDRGHLQVARVLIEAGADVNVKDRFYKSTPLDWAAAGGHGALVALLLGHGAKGAGAALRAGCSSGSIDVVRAVLQSGRVPPETMAACRDLASDRGHQEIVRLIDAALGQAPAPPLEVPREVLQRYVGSYQSDQGWEYDVRLKDGHLFIGSPYRSPVRLRAIDERTFKFFGTTYQFDVEQGRAVGFSRRTSPASRPMLFKRVSGQEARPARGAAGHAARRFAEKVRQEDLAAASPNWPQFRGTGARGIGDGQNAPSRWNVEESEGVRWKTPIPGLGHSSPIVWGDRVFVTTATSRGGGASIRTGLYGDFQPVEDDSWHTWQVFCLDLLTGEVLWVRTAHQGVPRFKRHPKSTHANPTPATDGEHVVAFFGPAGLYCYDLNGRLLWEKMLGPLDSGWFYDEEYQWGFGSSPILYDGMAIVQCDVQKDSFIAAYDVQTGEQIWRTSRDEIPTWGTPTVCQDAHGAMLITNGSRFARGYDPHTGVELWRLSGHSEISVPTPLVADGLIYVSSGYRPIKPIYAIRLTARGDISLAPGQSSNQYIAWSTRHGGPYLPTPLVYGDYLYVCSNSGILTCYEAKTGRRVYQRRVRSGGAKSFAASPVAADGRIYLTSEEGVVLVVRAGPEFQLLEVNPVGEYCLATPAISQGLFLLRTEHHVIAVGGRN